MNSNKILGSAGETGKRDGNHPHFDRRVEEREGAAEGEHKQEWVKKGASVGDQDDIGKDRGHEAGDDDSVVVLPLYGDEEVPRYTGGYTVRRHGLVAGAESSGPTPEAARGRKNGGGGHAAVAIDAVQLEFGSRFRRTPQARTAVAEAVAATVFDYLQNQTYKKRP